MYVQYIGQLCSPQLLTGFWETEGQIWTCLIPSIASILKELCNVGLQY